MRSLLFFMLLSTFLLGCESTQPKSEATADRTPKSSYGQAVHGAGSLGDDAEQRNEELEKQAGDLFDDG